jgi:hypothetical protein
MQHNGWQTVTVASYAAFKAVVNNNGWDLDGAYGDQCYDLAFLLCILSASLKDIQ